MPRGFMITNFQLKEYELMSEEQKIAKVVRASSPDLASGTWTASGRRKN